MVTRTGHAEAPRADPTPDRGQADPVQLELMSNRFMSIARQMGHVLRRTASSTNIRERLDFSCAVFNRDAALVANAPHIPVHLGAMGESVAAINALHPNPARGDVFVSNDPGMGGSHLPDITVVSPVHAADGKLIFYVASRGHHADVGGKSPGSMPADSTRLDDEGVVFRGEKIVSEGVFLRAVVLQVLEGGPYPARLPDSNVADLEAQIAANRRGVELLSRLVTELGSAFVERYMGHILDYAEERVALLISGLPNGTLRCSDQLDDGTLLNVELTMSSGRLVIDFTGTSPEHPGNLNAPRAVTLSAVLYVLRTLVQEDIPLNSGCLRPVTVIIPRPSLLSPGPNAAVAAGNVETSQRVVDILLGALGKMAASQGTMNNLTFGNDQLGYYETLAGGAGAGRGFVGASAVHTHMTNTRITDAEVLEARYPVRVLEFSVRRGSGGDGRWRGGDGLIRELEFLSPLTVSIVSDRRTTLPFGICGGHAAAPGQNLLNGKALLGRAEFQASRGDRLRIETPGGGGYGPPSDSGLGDDCE
jgi:5-oxoprolinase (ATP-hydrolysing)